MKKISCYQTTQNQLPKAFCQLIEKCYYSNSKTNVLTMSSDYSENLDRVLWTYSKKHFIPHATCLDPQPDRQPVYITHELTKYNQAEFLVFINASQSLILESIAKKDLFQSKIVKKVLFIFDETQKMKEKEIKFLLEKSDIGKFEINAFCQTLKGSWETLPLA
ncbi:MAG: DNA polymerase III subunit chi [Rickettsiaceae bacterium]|nr:DNA polymerase III subunit chi [Rickettsiaceae bacterium]